MTDFKKRESIKRSLMIALGLVSGTSGGMLTSGLGAGGAGGGAVSIPNLPNGTLIYEASNEVNQIVFFSITEQFYDLTTTSSFNIGERLLGTVEIGFEGDTNAQSLFIVRMLIEGVEVKTAGQTAIPATGAGDTWQLQPMGTLSGTRTLTSGGTKTLRIGVVTSGIGNGNVVLYNRRIYRIKNASS